MSIVYLFISQSIGLLLGIAKSLILPIFLTIDDFGYWQIYLLYVGYLGVLSFGFNDGLLARYGKFNFSELPIKKIGSSIKFFMIFILMLSLICFLAVYYLMDNEKKYIFLLIIMNIPISILTGIFLFLLQSTNQIKKYSVFSTVDKILMIMTILILYIFDFKNIYIIIIVDTLSKLIQMVMLSINFKVMLLQKIILTKSIFLEIIENIKRGSFILMTNLIGMLLFGYGMFLIERTKDIEVYSNYSLSISTTNILLLFINAMAIFVFPYLSRINKDEINKNVLKIDYLISLSSIFLPLFYFTIEYVVETFLGNFEMVLFLLPYVFLAVVLQLRYITLLLPISKLKNNEYTVFKINVYILIVNILLTTLAIYYFDSIILVAIVLLISVYFRNLFVYFKVMQLANNNKRILLLESVFYILFLLLIFKTNYIYGFIIYLCFLLIYLIINFKKIKKLIGSYR